MLCPNASVLHETPSASSSPLAGLGDCVVFAGRNVGVLEDASDSVTHRLRKVDQLLIHDDMPPQ